MNVEIGTEAAQFPEKGYKNGILLVVHRGGQGSFPGQDMQSRDLKFRIEMTLVKSLHIAPLKSERWEVKFNQT